MDISFAVAKGQLHSAAAELCGHVRIDWLMDSITSDDGDADVKSLVSIPLSFPSLPSLLWWSMLRIVMLVLQLRSGRMSRSQAAGSKTIAVAIVFCVVAVTLLVHPHERPTKLLDKLQQTTQVRP